MERNLPEGTFVRMLLIECGAKAERLATSGAVLPLLAQVVHPLGLKVEGHIAQEAAEGGYCLMAFLDGVRVVIQAFPGQSQSVVVEICVPGREPAQGELAHQLAGDLRAIFAPRRYVVEPGGLRPDTLAQDELRSPWIYEPLVHVPLLLHPQPRSVILCPDGESGMAKEALRHHYLEQVLVISSREALFRRGRQPAGPVGEGGLAVEARLAAPADVVVLDLSRGADGSLIPRALGWASAEGLVAFRLPDSRPALPQLAAALADLPWPPQYYWLHAPGLGLSLFGVVGRQPLVVPGEPEIALRLQRRKLDRLRIVTAATLPAMFALPPLVRARLAPIMLH